MKASERRVAMSAVSVLALAIAVPAQAQVSAPAEASSAPDEIVVTANKREQSINDVGLSITAQTGEALLNRGINSPTDLGKIVPGLTVQPSPFNTPVYTLRGIGFYETTLSAAPTVAVYTDEVALPFSATTRGVAFDIQRVEVLKGPQGTLFGQNTTGGAINYIANKPTDHFDAGADLSYGRFNVVDGQAFISGPIGDSIKARLAVRGVHGDEWQYSYTRNDKLGRTRQLQGRFQLQFDPGSNFRLLLNANGWIDKGDTQAAQIVDDTCRLSTAGTCGSPAALAFKAYPRAPNNARAADWGYGIFGRRPQRDDKFWQVSARADLDLSDQVTLTSITAYSDYKTDSVQDFDGTTLFSVDTNTTGFIKDFSQELRLAAKLDKLNIIVGGNYDRARTFDRLFYNFSQGPSSDPLFSIPGAPKGELTFNYSRQNVTTYAAFGNVEFELSPNVTLLGGARYTKSKRSFEGCTNDFGGGTAIWWNALFGTNVQPGGCLTFTPNFPVIFNPADFDKLNEDNVAWNVGVNYKTNNDILLYARVSRGYKSGSFPTASVASYTGYTPVKQESVTAYEVGIKARFANRAVEIAAAGFYYDYTDKQLRGRKPDPVFGTLDGLVQIPKSRVYGFEAQINVRPMDGLTISAGGTYINTKIKEFQGYDALGVLRNFSGQKFPYAPDLTAIGDAEYEWGIGSSAKAYLGASVTYNSQTTTALANTNTAFVSRDARFIIKEYAILDLRAGVRLNDGKLRIGGYLRNATNAFYWTNIQDNLASISRFTGMPRTYGVQLSWRY
ncbi:TonB-dependent receptor [Novosphingobium sp. G106]|uniref:TonB-dependent receptor n=1 Tax=Novosphingobium sp. G106 TaxID=2849500 RepID=UPI001C2DB3D4|nr:TonB-dependent receptor [Novosphingobium sp. G106]MBV1689483.1 TonB-dependent receptor [Novosphingobium sp. G106]